MHRCCKQTKNHQKNEYKLNKVINNLSKGIFLCDDDDTLIGLYTD